MSRSKNAARKNRYSTSVDRHSNNSQNVDPAVLNGGSPGPTNGHASKHNLFTSSNGQSRSSRAPTGQPAGARDPKYSAQRRSPSSGRHTSLSHQNGQKRKAVDDSSNSSKRYRPGADQDDPFMDEAYFRRTMEYPSRSEYPRAPPGLFGDQFISALHNIGQNALGLKQDFQSVDRGRHSNSSFVCTTHCSVPGNAPLRLVGHGHTKRDAARAAYVHLICKLHEVSALKDLFPAPEIKIDQQLLREERDAKLDVYNYAARFGYIPEFTERQVNRHGGLSQRGRIIQGGKNQMVEVTIEVKEQGIKTSGRGKILDSAEIAASIRFKEEAEKFHAEHGDESIVIKDSTALNTGNAKLLFDYYKLENKGAAVEVETKLVKSGVKTGGSLYKGDVLLNKEPVGVSVFSKNKKTTEELAYLVAAVTLTQKDPELLTGFQRALAAGGGTAILTPLRALDLELDEGAITLMQRTVIHARKLGLPDAPEVVESEQLQDESQTRQRPRLDEHAIATRSKSLQERLTAFNSNSKSQAMRDLRASLPMTQYGDKVLELVNSNLYSIIIGATGSGKTTQVPQILLDDAISKGVGGKCDVICTQPRRIAATSVARRVADERGEALQQSVGYHVRFDAKNAQAGGSINFCTTGILLQQLQRMPDEIFDTVSHIVVDEVHERDILIDFLMILLKKTVHSRRLAGKSVPKIVLMSATIDSELFAKYFEEATKEGKKLPCPSLSVPGRTFPVKERYYETILKEMEQAHGEQVVKSLEHGLVRGQKNVSLPSDDDTRDYMNGERSFKPLRSSGNASQDEEIEATIDWKRERTLAGDGETGNEKEDALVPVPLVATTVAHIAATSDEGAVLVFLPGFDEIKKVRQFLEQSSPLGVNFNDASKFKISMLHSSVPAAEQAEVFEPVPAGCRKIILSTNIAETSVTIPDIQYVVDSGKLREKRYDQVRRITKLQCTWISKSNAKQRAGRAGRVQNGNYYALFSKARYESFRSVGLPEMLRSDLQEICLDIKAQAFKTPIRDFLAQAIEPPSPAAVDSSVLNLISLDALTGDEKLTALGRVLASLPVHPTLGKMIILGIIFRCLDPMIILGAALNERSPFLSPPEKRNEAARMHQRFVEGTASDHVALINAIRQVRAVGLGQGQHSQHQFAIEHFVHLGAYKTIYATCNQIEEILIESGLIPYTNVRDRFDGELGHPLLNKNANNVALIKALTLAGTHPNLAVCRGVSFRTPGEKAAMIHPSSMNYLRPGRNSSVHPHGSLFSYSTMQKSNDGSQMNLRETTAMSPLMAVLFGGKIYAEGNIVKMDEWLPFFTKSSTWRYSNLLAKTLVEFRKTLDQVLAIAYASIKPQQRAARNRNKAASATSIGEYLADDTTREAFAAGLVELLDKDVSSMTQERPREVGKDVWRPSVGGREGGKDVWRFSGRDLARDGGSHGGSDRGRDSDRDSGRGGGSGRSWGRDRDGGRDGGRDGVRDGGRVGGRSWARDRR